MNLILTFNENIKLHHYGNTCMTKDNVVKAQTGKFSNSRSVNTNKHDPKWRKCPTTMRGQVSDSNRQKEKSKENQMKNVYIVFI